MLKSNDLNQPKAASLDLHSFATPMVGPGEVKSAPSAPAGLGGKGKLSKAAAMTKARKAYDNAKARCKKAGPTSTTQFLFKSFHDFLVAVEGPPDRADHSLDRVDPSGHYEPGNVRWTNKSVQSANKKGFKHGSKPTFSATVSSIQREQEVQAQRAWTAKLWDKVVRCYRYNEGHDTIEDQLIRGGVREAFRGQRFPLYRGPYYFPDSYRLPSLTRGGEVIRLVAQPQCVRGQDAPIGARRFVDFGVFPAHDSRFDFNVRSEVLDQVLKDIGSGERNGALWTLPQQAFPLDPAGPIDLETVLIAIGWHLSATMSVAVTPALAALEDMTIEYGKVELSARLERYLLIIPDFQVSGEAGWQSTDQQIRQLTKLIETRSAMNLPTLIGVENPRDLRRDQLRSLLAVLEVRELASRHHYPPGLLEELSDMNAAALARWERAVEMNKYDP